MKELLVICGCIAVPFFGLRDYQKDMEYWAHRRAKALRQYEDEQIAAVVNAAVELQKEALSEDSEED